ncbi:MBT domain-containing protein 1-like isoform X2 [Gigantopelta aegis]|nr:MBT domain-containing protein 1-like isoform X2 [Gigantopelta aegis]
MDSREAGNSCTGAYRSDNWEGLGDPSEIDLLVDDSQDSCNITNSRVQTPCEGSNYGGDEDYMASLGMYDGYDSYNESDSSGEDEENQPYQSGQKQPFSDSGYRQGFQQTVSKPSHFRFMNGRDGMAKCEKCGTFGIKHAFYSKSKRFCSLSCSRSFATSQREGSEINGNGPTVLQAQKSAPPKKPLASKGRLIPKKNTSKQRTPSSPKSSEPAKGFDWGPYLQYTSSQAAPVSCFRHAPMSECWDQMMVGMKVEVLNQDSDLPNQVFWIATVIKIAGYRALVRYEGFGADPSHDFWLNLCAPDVYPVGWCATVGKPLLPPKSIQHKYIDWKDFLVKRLTGSRTLPNDFYDKVQESINNHKFRCGIKVEVVDKMCVSAMRVACVREVIGGRLRLTYVDSQDENDEFWCDKNSPLIHPVGWAQQTGHKLHASSEYKSKCLTKVTMQKYDKDDATPDMFVKMLEPPHGMKFQVGMKLEAIDPLNLSTICVATVMKVLRNNYIMIGIDGSLAQNGTDWFCYHATSACIFPVGFCEINGLPLSPPRGYKAPFKWFDYLKQTKAIAAPVKLFDKEIPKHGFKPGMKVEAVDLMEPRLICVGTVMKVVGRLMKIHFDGWENEYDQWVDATTSDLYPVGWTEIMNYNLEGPRIKSEVIPSFSPPIHKKKRGKTQIYKGPRKNKTQKKSSKLLTSGKPFPTHFKFLSELSSLQKSAGSDITCPPHMSLPPEAVAATLSPLIDTSLPPDLNMQVTDTTYPSSKTGIKNEDVPPLLSPHHAAEPQNSSTVAMPNITDLPGHTTIHGGPAGAISG